ncbi:hypothetical protein [Burkholderia pseudomallei]|uniref:hypothetical protein n=1 Tax=Burkholderia pseudomallei TaxID=28450 RepID=UPI0009B224F1|nr:hypothetical protein [Burkholderia pseudomallei]
MSRVARRIACMAEPARCPYNRPVTFGKLRHAPPPRIPARSGKRRAAAACARRPRTLASRAGAPPGTRRHDLPAPQTGTVRKPRHMRLRAASADAARRRMPRAGERSRHVPPTASGTVP